MNELLIPDSPLAFIPEKYRAWAVLLVAASPYITRAYYSLSRGGGLKGVIASIWLGTNTPKQTTKHEEPKP